MDLSVPDFAHEYDPGAVHFGENCVSNIEAELEKRGLEGALLVAGKTTGTSEQVAGPVKEGAGERLAGVFPETTPAKYVGTAYDGVEAMREHDADAIIALGGGATLDVAKAIVVLLAEERSVEELKAEVRETGVVSAPEGEELTPIFAVPTTLAGADLSIGGGLKFTEEPEGAPSDEVTGGSTSDPRLMPEALFYDPELFATTPDDVLASSAMNGFDKGIEMLYSRHGNPVTDATAIHGLRLLKEGLPGLRGAEAGDEALDQSIVGTVLVQYGLSTPGTKKLSIIHAFGHGFSRPYPVQQGSVHGICAPHVLRYLFEHVDGRREAIAEGLGVAGPQPGEKHKDEPLAERVVGKVADIRDALGLPDTLRHIEGLERDHLPGVAEDIMADANMENVPEGLDASAAEIEDVLEEAW